MLNFSKRDCEPCLIACHKKKVLWIITDSEKLIYFDNPKSHKLANHPHSANHWHPPQNAISTVISFSYVSDETKKECYELLSQGQTVTEDQSTIMALNQARKEKHCESQNHLFYDNAMRPHVATKKSLKIIVFINNLCGTNSLWIIPSKS